MSSEGNKLRRSGVNSSSLDLRHVQDKQPVRASIAGNLKVYEVTQKNTRAETVFLEATRIKSQMFDVNSHVVVNPSQTIQTRPCIRCLRRLVQDDVQQIPTWRERLTMQRGTLSLLSVAPDGFFRRFAQDVNDDVTYPLSHGASGLGHCLLKTKRGNMRLWTVLCQLGQVATQLRNFGVC